MTINDISVFNGPPYDPSISYSGNGRGSTYNNWDKSSVTICDCGLGYFGADCSLGLSHMYNDVIQSCNHAE